jgi:CRISPR-associated exonuclease Cas4
MPYAEDELLPLSALQHYAFCERQCALIHLEGLWRENLYTTKGTLFHRRVIEEEGEWRDGVLIVRALPLRCLRYGLAGVADVVEFHPPPGAAGKLRPRGSLPRGWTVLPIEYKRGRPKGNRCDEIQLCAQALCLEEMLETEIVEGALFYGRNRRRFPVPFDVPLRSLTAQIVEGVRRLLESDRTPAAPFDKRCKKCSLLELCRPDVTGKHKRVGAYLDKLINEDR